MIVTAAFLLGTSYESAHLGDDYDLGDGAAFVWLLLLLAFMYFDYQMAQVIA